MAVVETRNDLCEYLPNKILDHVLLSLDAPLNYLLQVASFAILHDNVDLQVAFVDAAFIKAHYIRMLKVAQNIHFRNDLLLLFVVHFSIIELFPDENAPVALPTDFTCAAKAT